MLTLMLAIKQSLVGRYISQLRPSPYRVTILSQDYEDDRARAIQRSDPILAQLEEASAVTEEPNQGR